MSSFGYLSSKDASAVEDLLSQTMDLYVLEQVAAINLAGFTDSALPTNLETRFRRLKSLPVSRQPDPVSSSKKLPSHSKSMAASSFSVYEKRNLSGRIKRVPSVQSRPLVSSSDQTRVFSGRIKRDSIGNIGSRRLSRDGKVLSRPTITTQTLKLLPREKTRTSSASSVSIDLKSSSSSEPDQEERSKQKPKSKLSVSWFDTLLLPSRAMGCLSFSKHNVIKTTKT
ncbi:unnamed protein product [Eruca vesicaria subsp. sativa]|uniref:Uncharacterized protein n=1 Tax=Eruca vesicaria subsp. sativa TaxID=29727 RepID=A0ABC8LU61_ERUVS|nr:unnamed protein product [Eruca vesicaria subsp. sativa]